MGGPGLGQVLIFSDIFPMTNFSLFKLFRTSIIILFFFSAKTLFASTGVSGGTGGGFGAYGGGMSEEMQAIWAFSQSLLNDPKAPFGSGTTVTSNGVTYKFPEGKEEDIIKSVIALNFYNRKETFENNPHVLKYVTKEDLQTYAEITNFHKTTDEKLRALDSARNPLIKELGAQVILPNLDPKDSQFRSQLQKLLGELPPGSPPFLPMEMSIDDYKYALNYVKIEPNETAASHVCSSVAMANWPYVAQSSVYSYNAGGYNGGMGMGGNDESWKKMMTESKIKNLYLLEKQKNSGVDFNARCPSGATINEELKALLNNMEKDEKLEPEVRAELDVLRRLAVGKEIGDAISSAMPTDPNCATGLDGVMSLKDICDLQAPLAHLEDMARNRTSAVNKAGVSSTITASSSRCSLTNSYSINNEMLMNGKITVRELSTSKSTEFILKDIPFNEYRKMLSNAAGL